MSDDDDRPASVDGAGLDRDAVDRAVVDLLLEKGYEGLTVAEVAGRAHAAASAIYEAWPSKVDLVTWILLENYRREMGPVDTGNVRDDLLGFVSRFLAILRGTYGSVAAAVLARLPGAREVEMARTTGAIRSYLQEQTTRILDRAARRGEIDPDGPFELVGETVRALGLYRLNVTLDPLEDEFAGELVDRILLPALRWKGAVPERTHPPPLHPQAHRASVPEAASTTGLDPEAIGEVVVDLLLEKGYEGLTVAEVARRAGTTAAAIYEAWRSKVDLVTWMLREAYRREIGPIDTGNVRDDLLTLLARFLATMSGRYGSVVLVVLIQGREAREGEGETATAIERIRGFLQEQITRILDRAARRGEVDPDGPFELVGETVRALIQYRLHVSLDTVDEGFYGDMVDRILLPAVRREAATP